MSTAWVPESHWDNHPDHSPEEWRREVEEENTRESYIAWVNSRLEEVESEEVDTSAREHAEHVNNFHHDNDTLDLY